PQNTGRTAQIFPLLARLGQIYGKPISIRRHISTFCRYVSQTVSFQRKMFRQRSGPCSTKELSFPLHLWLESLCSPVPAERSPSGAVAADTACRPAAPAAPALPQG